MDRQGHPKILSLLRLKDEKKTSGEKKPKKSPIKRPDVSFILQNFFSGSIPLLHPLNQPMTLSDTNGTPSHRSSFLRKSCNAVLLVLVLVLVLVMPGDVSHAVKSIAYRWFDFEMLAWWWEGQKKKKKKENEELYYPDAHPFLRMTGLCAGADKNGRRGKNHHSDFTISRWNPMK